MIFLSPAIPRIPDPLAASYLIQKLNKIYAHNIETEDLLKKQEEIQSKLRELTEKVATLEEKQNATPSRYLA